MSFHQLVILPVIHFINPLFHQVFSLKEVSVNFRKKLFFKRASAHGSSSMLSLPLQLVFPGLTIFIKEELCKLSIYHSLEREYIILNPFAPDLFKPKPKCCNPFSFN